MGIKGLAEDMGISFSTVHKTDAGRGIGKMRHTNTQEPWMGNRSAQDRWRKQYCRHTHAECDSSSAGEAHVSNEIQYERHGAARKSAKQREAESVQSAVAGSVARQKQQRQKQQQRWHVALEKNRFFEEHEAFLAQSAASRAEHAKEVEELKGTRSPTRHAMALQSHRCSCCRWMLCPSL